MKMEGLLVGLGVECLREVVSNKYDPCLILAND